MPAPDSRRRALVLCPMKIERAAIGRALRTAFGSGEVGGTLSRVALVQTGIGRQAIVAAAARALDAPTNPPTLVILAGACGGLAPAPDVPAIARVVDEHGNAWTPLGADPAGVTLVAADRIVATPADKRTLARATGAAIVDMESHALASFCESRAVPWTVVRGVSDTPDETLPHQVLAWITPCGDTRPARAAWDMLRAPTLVPHIVGVVRRSNRVLPLVGDRVADLARRWLAGELQPAPTHAAKPGVSHAALGVRP